MGQERTIEMPRVSDSFCEYEACPQRSPLTASVRFYRWASLLLFVVVAAWGLHSLPDYGMSWDEYFRWQGGQEKLLYYKVLLSGGDAQAVLPAEDSYPGLFDLSVALANEVLPFGLLAVGHGFSLAFGLAALVGVWAIGRLLGGDRLAFWCVLFLCMTPRFYGHMFFNPKDIPFAAGMTWSLYFLLRWGRWLPRPRLGATLALGVVIGLTLALRIGGLVVFGYVAGYAGLVLLRELFAARRISREWMANVFRISIHGVVMLGVSVLVLIPWWPSIHSNPLYKIYEAVAVVSEYPWGGYVLFQGTLFRAADLPWYYPLTWMGITVPDFLFLVLMTGGALFAGNLRHSLRTVFSPQGMPWLVVAVAVCFPFVYVIARDSILYDGIRHLLFVLPPLACLAAFAWVCLLDYLERKRPHWRTLAVGALAAMMAIQMVVLYRLHPYEYMYFNQLGGGVVDKAGRYETEYWGTSLREANLWLDRHTEPQREYRVATTAPVWLAMMSLPERFRLVRWKDDPDFFISLTRLNFDQRMNGKIIHVVERYGVPLAVVKDVRGRLSIQAESPEPSAPEADEASAPATVPVQ